MPRAGRTLRVAGRLSSSPRQLVAACLLTLLIGFGAIAAAQRLVVDAHRGDLIERAALVSRLVIEPRLETDLDQRRPAALDALAVAAVDPSTGAHIDLGLPHTATTPSMDAIDAAAAGTPQVVLAELTVIGSVGPGSGPVSGEAPLSVLVAGAAIDGEPVVHQIEFDVDVLRIPVERDVTRARAILGLLLGAFLATQLGLYRATVWANRTQELRAVEAAAQDVLTGLPTRHALPRHLDDLVASGATVTIIAIDVNRLKEINDTLGFEAGDALLQETSLRMLMVLGAHTMYRVGGDLFTIVCAGPLDDDGALELVGRLNRSIEREFILDGHSVTVRATFGVARHPDHGNGTADLLRQADAALHAAKRAGEILRIFTPELDRVYRDRVALAGDLRIALDQGGLDLVFQPIVHGHDRRIAGVEALVRWNHQGSMIPPDRFVAVAEEVGLTHELTQYVLARAVARIAELNAAGWEISVAVNVFPEDIVDAGLPLRVAQHLLRNNVPPERLRLEITERSEIRDTVGAAGVMRRLKKVGVRVSIDDFGSGSWSLRHLHRLPVDAMKIDRGLVVQLLTDEGATAMVSSLATLAHELGKEVVAEGVEDEETFVAAVAAGADYIQGYFISRPVRFEELVELLEAESGAALQEAS